MMRSDTGSRLLEQALYECRIVIFYQPIKSTAGRISGVEALVRVNDETGALVGPALFMQDLDDPSLARDLGLIVMDAVFGHAEQWHLAGLDLKVSMNVSPSYLHDDRFVPDLKAALQRYPGAQPELIELEVTETAPMPDIGKAEMHLQACNKLGVRVAIDDFGVGNASFSYLQTLSAQTLKIDRSYISRMIDAPQDMAIVTAIITACRMLGIDVVAEGVETDEQAKLLAAMGAGYLQGYLYSEPMPADHIADWIERNCSRWRELHKASTIDLVPTILAGHVHRTARFLAAFKAKNHLPDNILDVSEVDRCHLGRWLKSDAALRFSSNPAFNDILELHEQLHMLAREAKLLLMDGEIEDARAVMRRFEEADQAMVSLINDLPKGGPS